MTIVLACAPKCPKTEGLSIPEPTPLPDEKVYAIQGWKRALLLPLGWFIRLWGATLRFEGSPETIQNLQKTDEPVSFVLWHNRLFIVAEIHRRFRHGRPIYALVSASKDGAWLDAFFSIVGIQCVRGSSSRLGREAVTALVNVMKDGNDIGITPDGPRGPRYDFKAGALIVSRRTHAPVLLLGAEFFHAWQFKSWDRFYLPLPFSKVRVTCDYVPNAALADRDESSLRLKERLLEISPDRK